MYAIRNTRYVTLVTCQQTNTNAYTYTLFAKKLLLIHSHPVKSTLKVTYVIHSPSLHSVISDPLCGRADPTVFNLTPAADSPLSALLIVPP